ncbi:MAG: hypothetical protein ABII13_05320 [Patescibacteria group bacterium]|nr:hypothetical protein [Patescibacteria group bacterium]
MKSKNRGTLVIAAPFIVISLDIILWFIFGLIITKIEPSSTVASLARMFNIIFGLVGILALIAIPFGIIYGIYLKSKSEDEAAKVKSNL